MFVPLNFAGFPNQSQFNDLRVSRTKISFISRFQQANANKRSKKLRLFEKLIVDVTKQILPSVTIALDMEVAAVTIYCSEKYSSRGKLL